MARAFGVPHLNRGPPEKLRLDYVTGAFAALGDHAGAGLTVALEFMPDSGMPDLVTAWQILRDAGLSDCALIVAPPSAHAVPRATPLSSADHLRLRGSTRQLAPHPSHFTQVDPRRPS